MRMGIWVKGVGGDGGIGSMDAPEDTPQKIARRAPGRAPRNLDIACEVTEGD
jgi:hypothetical protein